MGNLYDDSAATGQLVLGRRQQVHGGLQVFEHMEQGYDVEGAIGNLFQAPVHRVAQVFEKAGRGFLGFHTGVLQGHRPKPIQYCAGPGPYVEPAFSPHDIPIV